MAGTEGMALSWLEMESLEYQDSKLLFRGCDILCTHYDKIRYPAKCMLDRCCGAFNAMIFHLHPLQIQLVGFDNFSEMTYILITTIMRLIYILYRYFLLTEYSIPLSNHPSSYCQRLTLELGSLSLPLGTSKFLMGDLVSTTSGSCS